VFTNKDVGTCDWALGDDVCPKQVRPWFCRIITWHGSRAGAGHQSATSLPQDCCYRHQHIHSHTHTSSSHLHFSSSSPPPHCSRPPIPEHINKSLLTSSSPQSVTVTRSRPPTPPFSILADRPLLPDPTNNTNNTHLSNNNHSHTHTAHRPMLLARQPAPPLRLLIVPTDCAKPHSGVLPQETRSSSESTLTADRRSTPHLHLHLSLDTTHNGEQLVQGLWLAPHRPQE
jgi:hypothetical protein